MVVITTTSAGSATATAAFCSSIGRISLALLLFLLITAVTVESRNLQEYASQFLSVSANGTRWAVLVAGSNGYYNYRHQVCNM